MINRLVFSCISGLLAFNLLFNFALGADDLLEPPPIHHSAPSIETTHSEQLTAPSTPKIASKINSKKSSTMGMVTGAKNATYLRFGEDIKKIAALKGIDITVKETEGSIDNISRMDSKENAAFGIVQSDVLLYLKEAEETSHIANKLRLIFPFYEEEVHILARKNINSLSDLSGKLVSVGPEKGGTWLTAINIFRLANIEPIERSGLLPQEALDYLLKGELDAMIFVGGKPLDIFQMKNVDAAQLKELHFIPLEDEKILKEYHKASLTNIDYTWMIDKTIPTISVTAMLVSFDFSNRRDSYAKLRCSQLAGVVDAIKESLPQLRKEDSGFHTKWRQVDLERHVLNWKKDACVTSNLGEKIRTCIKSGKCNKEHELP